MDCEEPRIDKTLAALDKATANELPAVNHYLADEHAKATAAKRGGNATPLELDALAAEERYRLEPAVLSEPERLFDRRWRLTGSEDGRFVAVRTTEGKLFHWRAPTFEEIAAERPSRP